MTTKRQDILLTAVDLFSRYGYQAVGIDRVIEKSGVAKMTMYRHFRSKDTLVEEVLTMRAGQIMESLAHAVEASTDAMEKVHAVFLWHQDWIDGEDFTGCMFAAALAEFRQQEGGIASVCLAQKNGLRSFFSELLADLVAPSEAQGLAQQLVMLIDGAILAAMAGKSANVMSDAWSAAQCLIESKQAER